MTTNTPAKEAENLICQLCGEEFSCGAKVGKCWCFDLEINQEILTELRSKFQNCLCGNCLLKLQSNEEK